MNMTMTYSSVGLNGLPDEILLIIFKKLNNINVLYSFQGVNQRLSQIVHDQIFTNRLTFVGSFSHDFIDLLGYKMILDRFCLQILPEIHNQIQWLDIHSTSMKDILSAGDYPNLDCLGLYHIDANSIQCLLTGKKSQINCFSK